MQQYTAKNTTVFAQPLLVHVGQRYILAMLLNTTAQASYRYGNSCSLIDIIACIPFNVVTSTLCKYAHQGPMACNNIICKANYNNKLLIINAFYIQ